MYLLCKLWKGLGTLQQKSHADYLPTPELVGVDWPGPPDKEVTTNQIGLLRTFMALTQDNSYYSHQTLPELAEEKGLVARD